MIPASVPASISRATTGAVLAVLMLAPASVRPWPRHPLRPRPCADRAAPACAPTPQDAWTLAQQAVAAGDAGLVTERLSLDFRARNALEMAIAASMLAQIGGLSGDGSASRRRRPRPRPPKRSS